MKINPELIQTEHLLFLPSTNELYQFNASGQFVWKLLCEGLPAHKIVAQMKKKYRGAEANLEQDISAFVSDLVKKHFLIDELKKP